MIINVQKKIYNKKKNKFNFPITVVASVGVNLSKRKLKMLDKNYWLGNKDFTFMEDSEDHCDKFH